MQEHLEEGRGREIEIPLSRSSPEFFHWEDLLRVCAAASLLLSSSQRAIALTRGRALHCRISTVAGLAGGTVEFDLPPKLLPEISYATPLIFADGENKAQKHSVTSPHSHAW